MRLRAGTKFTLKLRLNPLLTLAALVAVCGLAGHQPQGNSQTAAGASAAIKSSKQRLPGLSGPVEVDFDRYGVPHIFASSVSDAYRALGYVHARDRLFQMEIYRRRGSGTLAEILGRSQLDDDIFIRQIGIRRTTEAIWKDSHLDPTRNEIRAYCDGINARIAEIGDHLPAPFTQLGIKPAPWTPVDALVFARYMAWDQSGTDTDVWMGMMVEKLGIETVNELFPIDRPYEISTIPAGSLDRQIMRENHAMASNEVPIPGGSTQAEAVAPRFPAGYDEAALSLHRRFAAGRMGSLYALGSNNWVVDGQKSATGKPLLANDPHLGFSLPSIWYTAELAAPGFEVTGVTFPGFPYVVIGHTDRVAWGLTNMQADAVDYFIEKTATDHPGQYFYKGEWRNLERREEDIPVRGEKPYRLVVECTVHGPLVTTHGATMALDWAGLEPSFEILAFRDMNRARNLTDFRDAMHYLGVPALNVVYADVDGNIAMSAHGNLPVRRHGLGRWPVDGASGDYDWLGYVPDRKLPFALNPPEHYLASANGRPAPVGYPYYLGWMWDPSYRTRRIHELLSTHSRVSVADMERFQTDAHDVAAEAFVTELLDAYDRHHFGDDTVRRALDELRRWDFVARPTSVAETIWVAWFEAYREAVWQNHWDAAHVEPWPGGWGYAGSNERQPELEVLEFLTREVPDSPWFDDLRTPARETRDDVLSATFTATIAKLVATESADMPKWQWGAKNILRLHSITGVSALDRGGIALPGDEFTLGPGDNGNEVTGGASWRMVVDMGALGHSYGMYPGGQSDDPASPHYADQMQPWADGTYLPLDSGPAPASLPAANLESRLQLIP